MILKIGHRGAMGHKPENTLESFQRALELGVDMIELDVRLCKTGEVVVLHDEKLDRTTNLKGVLREKTLEEVNPEVPTLKEVINLVKTRINIEIKEKEATRPTIELIEKNAESDFLISSFDLSVLKEAKKLNPSVKISLIIKKIPSNLEEILSQNNLYSIALSLKIAKQEIIDFLHQKGIKVFVWTVNNRKKIEKLKQMKVDGIISDFPERA